MHTSKIEPVESLKTEHNIENLPQNTDKSTENMLLNRIIPAQKPQNSRLSHILNQGRTSLLAPKPAQDLNRSRQTTWRDHDSLLVN